MERVADNDLQAIADEIRLARDGVRQIEPITSRRPDFDLRAAYAVLHLNHEARLREGALPVGRKIGFTNPAMWARYGVREPIWAYVYNTTVVPVDHGHCRCRIGSFCEPMIEPEIVLHFHATPPPGADPLAVLACVDWIAPAFEIVQSHFPGWKFEAADTVADFGLHATLLLGKPLPIDLAGRARMLAALASFSVDLNCGDEIRERGHGANVLGSPLAAVVHLLAALAKQPQYPPLQAKELVSTGTLTTAQPVRIGETWRSDLHGIGLDGLAVQFVD